jgi:signal transduction histidine kinase
VTVVITGRDGRLTACISDDGVGEADMAGGSGLRGLADRIEALGGTLALDSPRGRGTRLAVEIRLGG